MLCDEIPSECNYGHVSYHSKEYFQPIEPVERVSIQEDIESRRINADDDQDHRKEYAEYERLIVREARLHGF